MLTWKQQTRRESLDANYIASRDEQVLDDKTKPNRFSVFQSAQP